jgi:hypothetical protein
VEGNVEEVDGSRGKVETGLFITPTLDLIRINIPTRIVSRLGEGMAR